MRIKNIRKTVMALLNVRLLKKCVPLAVRWQITDRCVLQCKYCNIWKAPRQELSFENIVRILDRLAYLGTQTVSFSGGEPMLRPDIAKILEETKKRNISTEMNSTGATIPHNILKLKYLDFLKISLDGEEKINDLIRGKGSFKFAIEAAEVANVHKLKFIFTATLTKYNINQIDFLIKISEKYNTLIAFQPLKNLYRGVKDMNELYPDTQEFKQAVDKLIRLKKHGNPHLRNSLIGLYHIYDWPSYPALKCWAGKIFCIIETDGTLMPCDRISYKNQLPNCIEIGLKEALEHLPGIQCEGCGFCGVLELNFLMALKLGTIRSIQNILK